MQCVWWTAVLLVGACGGASPADDSDDAGAMSDDGACDRPTYYEIVAPRPELHYTPSLDVYIDTELDSVAPVMTLFDDEHGGWGWTYITSAPIPDDPQSVRERYRYDLAPGRRYELSVSSCADPKVQTVEFFTSD